MFFFNRDSCRTLPAAPVWVSAAEERRRELACGGMPGMPSAAAPKVDSVPPNWDPHRLPGYPVRNLKEG